MKKHMQNLFKLLGSSLEENCKSRVSTLNNYAQLLDWEMQNVLCMWWAFNGPSAHFFIIQNIYVNSSPL